MSETLANLLREERRFEPPADLAAHANVTAAAYDEANADRLGFWETQAKRLSWSKPWDTVLDWSNPPFAKWFAGGQLNMAYNCVDRHVEAGRGDKVAIHWEGEPGDTRTITYADLLKSVCQAANALTSLGVVAGDRVAIYMPMIPEAAIAMLACARIGAAHSVVFGGFSVEALSGRINDANAKLVITADGGFRRGNPSGLKPIVDDSVDRAPSVEHVLVVRRTGQDVNWTEGRDVWWHERHDGQAEGHPAHHRRLSDAGELHIQRCVRPQAGDRHLLVYCRHRLGHRALVHRVWTDVQRCHADHVRRDAGHTE
jgi:acetyl-CoA synthetase